MFSVEFSIRMGHFWNNFGIVQILQNGLTIEVAYFWPYLPRSLDFDETSGVAFSWSPNSNPSSKFR